MSRNKRTSFILSWKPVVLAGIVLVLLGLLQIIIGRQQNARYWRLLGDERVELQHTSVPPDVRQWVSRGGVLGVSADDVFQIQLLPKEVRVPILMYHYVEYVKDKNDTIRQSLSISPYTFEEQVKTLLSAGYTFMTNAELSDAMSGKITLPPKPIVLTFDDGYRDFYTDVYPILKTYHVKATAYIISGFLDYPNNMFSWQVKEIADSGLVEIGAHTVDHAWLRGLPKDRLTFEVEESKHTLEQLTEKPVVSFAYPYGVFDVPAIEELTASGFTSAVSTIPGVDQLQTNRYFLYRLRPGAKTGENLLSWLKNVKDEQITMLSGQAK